LFVNELLETNSRSECDNFRSFFLAPLDGVSGVIETKLKDIIVWHQGLLWNEKISVVDIWVYLHEFEKVFNGLIIFLNRFISIVKLESHWHMFT